MFNFTKQLLFFLLISSALHANQENKSSLYYVKLGAVHPPGDSCDVLPNFGVGVRFQTDYYGFDLSANLGSLIFINYASLKGVFLLYPWPEECHQFYFGVGPGVGYHLSSVPMGGPFGSATREYGNITLEGVVGYEFRHAPHFKTFIQLELSQPIIGFGRHRSHCNYSPGVGLTGGFGF
jgi:hypothetical protein